MNVIRNDAAPSRRRARSRKWGKLGEIIANVLPKYRM